MSHAQEWDNRYAAEIHEAWNELLRQPWGRKLLFKLIDSTEFCGVDASTYRPDLADQSYRNGLRDAGLRLRLAAQEANPEMYLRMVGESMNIARARLAALRSDAEEAARETAPAA